MMRIRVHNKEHETFINKLESSPINVSNIRSIIESVTVHFEPGNSRVFNNTNKNVWVFSPISLINSF